MFHYDWMLLYFQEASCQYWPITVGQLAVFGEYTVDLISEEAFEGFTIRTISILHKKVTYREFVTRLTQAQVPNSVIDCHLYKSNINTYYIKLV